MTSSQPHRRVFNDLTEHWLTIGAAHLFHFFACRIRRFQPELEVFAKNPLYFRKLLFSKFRLFIHLPIRSTLTFKQQDSAIIPPQQNKNKIKIRPAQPRHCEEAEGRRGNPKKFNPAPIFL
jgi:hypothetical protein